MGRGGASVQVEGLNKLTRDLVKLGVEVADLKVAFGKIATRATSLATGFAPKQSGRLAASIRGSRAKSSALIRVGAASVPYVGPIHWGWGKRNIKPNPFMLKAQHAITPEVVPMLEYEIRRLISKEGL